MPVIIDDCAEPVSSTNLPIIIGIFQIGPTVDNIVSETHTTNISMEYAEFMQMVYSRTGEFIFRPSICQASEFLLLNYEKTHPITSCIKSAFVRESRIISYSGLISSSDLHNFVNGPFTAVMDIVVMSQVLQFGIKQRVVFSVASAPYKPELKVCNNAHIYQIVIGEHHCHSHC